MSAKVDKTGSCSFCGQTKIIQVPEEWEQGQINEAVTCECECEQAQACAKAKERKDKAKKRVNELFGGGAEKRQERYRDTLRHKSKQSYGSGR